MASTTGGDALDPAAKFIFSVLKNTENLNIAWAEVAKENGIKHDRNASAKFKEILKKYGYKLESNTIVPLDGSPKSSTKGTSPSKRKASKDAGSSLSHPTSVVKRKKSAPVSLPKVEDETDGEAEESGDEEEVVSVPKLENNETNDGADDGDVPIKGEVSMSA